MWEIFADFRLTAKTMENACAMFLGNAVTCLSGRTAVYRTCIFRPTSKKGPGNPHANRLFGFQQNGFRPSEVPPDASVSSSWKATEEQHGEPERVLNSVDAAAQQHVSDSDACQRLYASFCTAFLNDRWNGKHLLVSGDDKFLTRWLVTHGWRMRILFGQSARIHTTFKPNWMFLKQYLRWTRNTWRSDFRSIFIERSVWKSVRDYCILIFLMLDKMIAPVTLLFGPLLIVALIARLEMGCGRIGKYQITAWNVAISYVVWVCITRAIRIFPHFFARPRHIIYVPMFALLNYLLAALKIYCLFTLLETGWGTRQAARSSAGAACLTHDSCPDSCRNTEAMDTSAFLAAGREVDCELALMQGLQPSDSEASSLETGPVGSPLAPSSLADLDSSNPHLAYVNAAP